MSTHHHSTTEGSSETPERRAELTRALLAAGGELGDSTVLFHAAIVAAQRLSATEEKALDLLNRFGPLTAGELARRSGLAPASVTGLINRLEQKGFAERIPHPEDRRSVLVAARRERLADLALPFGGFPQAMRDLFANYSIEQLETILGFIQEVTRRQREATAQLAPPETDM